MIKFKTVVLDCPWKFSSPRALIGNGGRGWQNGKAALRTQVDVSKKYPTMSIDELSKLPIKNLVDDNAHIYMWAPNSFICQAHDLVRTHGFKPKTIISWIKIKKSKFEPSMSTGYWYRSATEHVVFGVRGKLRLKGVAPTAFLHERLPHSQKPEKFYTEIVEKQSQGPYLELFGRKPREGWIVLGNEIDGLDIFESMKKLEE